MEKNRLAWKIGGAAGEGIMATGLIFSQACTRGGLYVFDTNEYPSLIRGGHNTFLARVEDKEIFAPMQPVDLLVALNQETVDLHKNEPSRGGGIIYDGEENPVERKDIREDIRLYSVPLLRLVKEIKAEKVMRNNVALGASIALVDYDFDILAGVIRDTFKRKGEKIINDNINAAKAGYDYIKKNYPQDFGFKLEKIGGRGRMLLTGNEAICLGALRAGCKFYAGYPMTPSSSILHFIAAQERRFSLVVKHTEDEISAINMAIGTALAGVRAMTTTSGGGFCLMTEGLGLAGMIEAPIVIVDAQRPGPSTGMATWTEQGDLRFILSASQGDFPRIVIAPGDHEECFYKIGEAFNLAEKYQISVLVLTDKYLAESHRTIEKLDQNKIKIDRGKMVTQEELDKTLGFKRYKLGVENGISPRSIPGQKGGVYTATGSEHDENGDRTEEIGPRKAMMEKRMQKLKAIEKELPEPELLGTKGADIMIIGWGSTKGPIKEAMKLLEKDDMRTSFLQIVYLNPFPAKKVAEMISSSKKNVIVENNYTGQLAGLIREKTGLEIKNRILKYDGRPFFPEEIYVEIRKILGG